MAITFQLQMDEGGETEGATPDTYRKELKYFAHVTEQESHAQVRAAAKEQLPVTYFNLIRTSITVPRRITFDTIFEVVVEFKHPGNAGTARPLNTGDVRVSIRSEGGPSQNLKFSFDAIRLTPGQDPLKVEDQMARAIGLQEDGSVSGVDVEANAIMVIVETLKSGNLVTPRYLLDAAGAKGKVNGFPYKGFPRGSLRLVNFDANEQVNPDPSNRTADWALNFAFHFEAPVRGKIPMYVPAANANQQGTFTQVPFQKEGHWYLDVFKSEVGVPFQGAGIDSEYGFPVTLWATLHQIYEYEDFETMLGI